MTEEDFARLKERVDALERRCDVTDGRAAPVAFPSPEGPGQIDFLSQMRGSPGFLVDEGVARDTPCTCYHVKESDLCFSKGIVGALDPEQEELFCGERDYRELSPAMQTRLEHFQESADACKVETTPLPQGEQLEPWLSCMTRELRARGIEQ